MDEGIEIAKEIAAVRSEVDWLREAEAQVVRERDEALEQVAVLSKSVLQLSLSLKRAEAVVEAVKETLVYADLCAGNRDDCYCKKSALIQAQALAAWEEGK